jgi:hypothetical protein
MTSPRQRKKWAAFLAKQNAVESVVIKPVEAQPVVAVKQPEQPVAAHPQTVVVSDPAASLAAAKQKKLQKNGLVELKQKAETSQEQVVEQSKPEVKTETKE